MGWGNAILKALGWAVAHEDEIKAGVNIVKEVRHKKPVPVPVEPKPLTVDPPVVVLPQPTILAPTVPVVAPTPIVAPTRVWAGWNFANVFAETDLNRLAAETGFSRDALATSRDQYLALMEASYRAQMTAAGRKTNGASAAVFASEHFRKFLETGTIGEL
jgi:hypothetical protein